MIKATRPEALMPKSIKPRLKAGDILAADPRIKVIDPDRPGLQPGDGISGPKPEITSLREAILGALHSWPGGPEAYILSQMRDNPTSFNSLMSKLIPRQVEAKVEHREASLEELIVLSRKREAEGGRDN